jgi:hypothetical protein
VNNADEVRMKKSVVFLIVMTMALWCAPIPVLGQDKDATSNETKPDKTVTQDTKPSSDQHATPIKPYRLEFSLYEIEAGKKINTRHYAMNLTGGSVDEIKIGTRVPVHTGPPQDTGNPLASTQYQYMDVGTNIWASLRERGDDLQLEVKSEISNLDMNTGATRDNGWLPPVVRQIKISGVTLLVTGKPIVIGSMDDPNSNREFQLEVTATKLR